VLLAVCATAHAAEAPKTYHAPRLPDGHADLEGNWTISNLTPLERPEGFTELEITAADAARLKAEYLDPPVSPNQPDDPGSIELGRSSQFEVSCEAPSLLIRMTAKFRGKTNIGRNR
jgi:hypothetical protein